MFTSRPLGPSRRTWAIGPPVTRRLWNYIHHRHLLSLSPKADTHFAIPQTIKGWVDLDGWLVTYPDCLSTREHSPIQTSPVSVDYVDRSQRASHYTKPPPIRNAARQTVGTTVSYILFCSASVQWSVSVGGQQTVTSFGAFPSTRHDAGANAVCSRSYLPHQATSGLEKGFAKKLVFL